MIILDGKKLNQEIAEELQQKIQKFGVPKIVIFQLGDNPASNIYIGRKIKFAEKIGAIAELRKFSDQILEEDFIQNIKIANQDEAVHGIIVQLPLPNHINSQNVFNSISQYKDVDGLSAENMYRLLNNKKSLVPATAKGIHSLLVKNGIEIMGKKVVVVGRSVLVGKPTALFMLNCGATITVCHSQTENLIQETKQADILIVAVGKPNLITDEHVKEGQVIVDVGINSLSDGKIVGDTNIQNFEILRAKSPVPGGVGPMTVASLFENLVETYINQTKNK